MASKRGRIKEKGGQTFWKAALLLSMVGSCALFLHDYPKEATIAGAVAALLGGLFRALYGPMDDLLDQLLPPGPLLKAVTFLSCIFLLALIIFRPEVVVEGYVFMPDGTPAENAIVTLLTGSQEQRTFTSKGKFEFRNVDPKATLFLKATLKPKNLEARQTVELPGKSPILGLILKPIVRPFRETYYTLEGHAVDFLLKGAIDSEWESRLGGQPYIIPNPVFRELQRLARQFATPKAAGAEATATSSNQGTFRLPQDVWSAMSGQGLLEATTPHRIELFSGASEVYRLLRSAPVNTWNLHIESGNGIISADARTIAFDALEVSLTKFATFEDMESLIYPYIKYSGSKETLEFYRYVTKDFFPHDFLKIVIRHAGCVDEMTVDIQARPLALRVAVVENVLDSPINVGEFELRELKQPGLRSISENRRQLDNIRPSRRNLFPQRILLPREKLLVPLALILQGDDAEVRYGHSILRADSYVFLAWGKEHLRLTGSIADKVNFESQPAYELDEYVFGPAVQIDSLEVESRRYTFRTFDPKRFVIYSETWGVGSCPYVFTFSPSSQTWINEGHILYGADHPSKERSDSLQLSSYDGRVVVRELDPENSFIDSLAIRVVRFDGSEIVLPALNESLAERDQRYLTLKQGERRLVEFKPYKLQGDETLYILDAVGYYEPYRY